jgi:hypothetical protein
MPILLPQKIRKGGVGADPQRRDDGPAFSARVFPWRKIPPGGGAPGAGRGVATCFGMFRRSVSFMAARLTATGLVSWPASERRSGSSWLQPSLPCWASYGLAASLRIRGPPCRQIIQARNNPDISITC